MEMRFDVQRSRMSATGQNVVERGQLRPETL